jgi:hypothetical protein
MPEAKAPGPPRFDPALEERLANYLKMATGRPPKSKLLNVEELLAVRYFIRRLRQQAVN